MGSILNGRAPLQACARKIYKLHYRAAPEGASYMYYMHYMYYTYYMYYVCYIYSFVFAGWFNSIGSQILYELDHRKPVLYVIPVEHILGKLPPVPVGDTGTIPHHLRNLFPGALDDRRPGAGDGCRMWFVN